MLPDRVGSVLSIKSLSEDLQVDFKTAARWISILENHYYVYGIPPFGRAHRSASANIQMLPFDTFCEMESLV